MDILYFLSGSKPSIFSTLMLFILQKTDTMPWLILTFFTLCAPKINKLQWGLKIYFSTCIHIYQINY